MTGSKSGAVLPDCAYGLYVPEMPMVNGRKVLADRRGSDGSAWFTESCGWALRALLANSLTSHPFIILHPSLRLRRLVDGSVGRVGSYNSALAGSCVKNGPLLRLVYRS